MISSPSYVDVLTCLQAAQEAEKLNAPEKIMRKPQ